jgi:hypothetical protein
MKKVLGWGFGILVLIVIVSGGFSDKTLIDNQESQTVQPVTEPIQAEETTVETAAPQVESESVEYAPAITQYEPEPVEAADDCDPNYSPCVPNVSYDLDCGDISFSVIVIGSDPHRFDRDNDGYGCESN